MADNKKFWSSLSKLQDGIMQPAYHKIILTEPFMKHYAGTIFDLGAPAGISGWHPDERVREKQSYIDQRTYNLPDDGKGLETELPLYYTVPFSDILLRDCDVNSGPCRITSVTAFDIHGQPVKNKDYPIPDGAFPAFLTVNQYGKKQVLRLLVESENIPALANITDKKTNSQIRQIPLDKSENVIYLDNLSPGFYELEASFGPKKILTFTFIKLFPFYIQPDPSFQNILQNTIW